MPQIGGAVENLVPLSTGDQQLYLVSECPTKAAVVALVPAAIEAAEGYLELVTRAAVRLGVSSQIRRKFAREALRLAKENGPCSTELKHEARRQMAIGVWR